MKPAGPEVLVQRLPGSEDLPLPAYETEGAAGLDLRAAIPAERVIERGEIVAIPTGMILAIPPGFEGQLRPRSGLALREGLSIPNAPGTIDCDYRGEVKVILINLGERPVAVVRGQRIAQLVIAPVAHATLREVATLMPQRAAQAASATRAPETWTRSRPAAGRRAWLSGSSITSF